MIRVLLAEDSGTTRDFLVELLREGGIFEVVAAARDGREALELTHRLRPDVVVMDIAMPNVDGFEATRRIMIDVPTPIVIMSARHDVHDVRVSMEALRVGALAVVPKPRGLGSATFQTEATRFLSKIRLMSQVKVVRRWAESTPPPPRREAIAEGHRRAVRVVAVAASTGGPAAIHRIFSRLPPDFGVPLIVVQHIARGFVEGFASWLDSSCAIRVKVADDGESLVGGTAYIAPDDFHLGLSDDLKVRLSDAAGIRGFRPSADFLFASAAEVAGESCLALVLTGMGQDGLEGLRLVRAAGGTIIAQDEATSVVFGMPGAVAAAGLADRILPLNEVAFHMMQACNRGFSE